MIHHRPAIITSIRELVFGLEDGLVSTLGAVIGIAAGTEQRGVVILSGVVIIAVEALSMAAGSYLSSKSHRQLQEHKIREEREEIETKPEEETEELRVMYRERGFNEEEVGILVRRVTANKELWLEEMMAKELKIGHADLDQPGNGAMVIGLAYIIGGAVPVAPFIFLPILPASILAIAATLIGLFSIGWWKAKVTGAPRLRSGLEMLLISSLAAGLGYVIGRVIGKLTGVSAF